MLEISEELENLIRDISVQDQKVKDHHKIT